MKSLAAGPKSPCRLKPALENATEVQWAAKPLLPLHSGSTSRETPLSCATCSCEHVCVCVHVRYTYMLLTVSIGVIFVWVAPVTVHMFAGCRCAEGYRHTHFPVCRCCEWRELSHPFSSSFASKFSSFCISGVCSLNTCTMIVP